MPELYCLSGPCGAGKTTCSAALAAELSRRQEGRQCCLLHGDDFHAVLIGDESSPAALPWPQVLQFNWACLLSAASHALGCGLDVVIDYVVEDELPLLLRLAGEHGARLRYAVLTAPEDVLRQRLLQRGDPHLTDRALFLRQKLLAMPENRGRIIDGTLAQPELLHSIRALPELLHCDIDTTAADGVS